jgi:hypothetical protein
MFSVPMNMKKLFLEYCLSAWMRASLEPEQLDRFHRYSAFMNLSVGCPMNMNILAPKIRALQMGPKNITAIFLKMALTIFIRLQKFMETTSLNRTA